MKGISSQRKKKDREIELARIAAEEVKADKDRELERDIIAAEEAKIAADVRLEMARNKGIAITETSLYKSNPIFAPNI